MRIAVIGAGLMGPAIASDCIECTEVEQVLLIDIDEDRLDATARKLGNPEKLEVLVGDVRDRQKMISALKGCDVACIALPRWLNVEAIWDAIEAGVSAIDLSGPPRRDWISIDKAAKEAGVTIMPGCGVEPGLTDLLAAYGMDMLDRVEAVEIWCGGIPQDPKSPLDYKIVFGGRYLPLRPGMVKVIENGEVKEVKRYTHAGFIEFEGIDKTLECFYDGFPEALYEVEKFKEVKRCSEKTVRYPGYSEKVRFLDECGLLSREPIEFEGRKIIPFEVFSRIIYPKVKLEEGEKDITVLRVIVEGVKNSKKTLYRFDMVDFYDKEKGFTSMARTTGYTAAIIARMIGRGEIMEKGLVPPVKVIREDLFLKLIGELREKGVLVKQVVTTSSTL